jgi:hypothetical protein
VRVNLGHKSHLTWTCTQVQDFRCKVLIDTKLTLAVDSVGIIIRIKTFGSMRKNCDFTGSGKCGQKNNKNILFPIGLMY